MSQTPVAVALVSVGLSLGCGKAESTPTLDLTVGNLVQIESFDGKKPPKAKPKKPKKPHCPGEAHQGGSPPQTGSGGSAALGGGSENGLGGSDIETTSGEFGGTGDGGSAPSCNDPPGQFGAGVHLAGLDGKPIALDPNATTAVVETRTAVGNWESASNVIIDFGSKPIHDVVVVADNSGSEKEHLPAETQAISGFLSHLLAQPKSRVGLLRVSTEATVVFDLTRDSEVVDAGVSSLFVSNGWTALWDGVRKANEVLKKGGSGPLNEGASCYPRAMKSIVVFTDGKENNSADEHVTKYSGDGIDTKFQDLLDLHAGKFSTAVYAVGVGNGVDEQSLSLLATTTGANYVQIADYASLYDAFALQAETLDEIVPVCFTPTCGAVEARITLTTTVGGQTITAIRTIALPASP